MRLLCVLLRILASLELSASFVANKNTTLDKRILVSRAQITSCTSEQKDIIKTTLRDISQISIFAIRVANISNIPVTRASTREGGTRFPEQSLRAFDRHARPAFERVFWDFSEPVRRSVDIRFRNLKYETERSEGGIFGDIHEGRVNIRCDNDRITDECKINHLAASAFRDVDLVVIVHSPFPWKEA